MRRAGDAGVEALAGVRGAYPARALRPVQSERVGREVRAPERTLEAGAQLTRLLGEPAGAQLVADECGEPGGTPLGRKHVALHLAERDRSLGERSVVVEDGVLRVLPPLVAEPAGCAACVLDEA